MEIATNRLTDRAIAVATTLAALYDIESALTPETHDAIHAMVTTEGVPHEEEVLRVVAWIRQLIETSATPRGAGMDVKCKFRGVPHELEALIAAWNDGDGAPSEAMITWASSFLSIE